MSARNRFPRIDGFRRQRRSLPPLLEDLESRLVLSSPAPASIVATPPIEMKAIIGPNGNIIPDQSRTPNSSGYTPQQLQDAYGVNLVTFGKVQGTGLGQTIAVIDAYNNPSFADSGTSAYVGSALYEFDKEFDLPDPPSFTIYNEEGQTTNLPGPDTTGDWGTEESLDIEWAHAMAPQATIDVVCANSDEGDDLYIAANTAATMLHASVVSMSFGADYEFDGEGSYEQTLDATYFAPALAADPDVTFLASTGDDGADPGDAPNYPSVSPLVVAVGGTTLDVGGTLGAYTWEGETGWSYDSPGNAPTSAGGGGVSDTYTAPTYQSENDIDLGDGFRTVPDVSSDANPDTGVWVYDPYDNGDTTPWSVVGGTSLSSPTWAGLIAIADQGRSVLYGLPALNGPTQTLPALYDLGSPLDAPANYSTYFHDITVGDNFYGAGPGYDLVTGIGSPQANNLLPALAAYGAATGAKVSIDPPSEVIQDGQFGMAIEATTSAGTLALGFSGTATVSLLSGPGTLGGTFTVDFEDGVAVFTSLTLSTVSATANDLSITVTSGTAVLAKIESTPVVVDQDATPNVGVYYPLPLDVSLRDDVLSADSDSTNATDDLYLVYSQAYTLFSGPLKVENTSTVSMKTIQFITDESSSAPAIINANQTSRVFDIFGMKGASTNLSVLFKGLVIEGGLARDDGGLALPGVSAVGGAL